MKTLISILVLFFFLFPSLVNTASALTTELPNDAIYKSWSDDLEIQKLFLCTNTGKESISCDGTYPKHKMKLVKQNNFYLIKSTQNKCLRLGGELSVQTCKPNNDRFLWSVEIINIKGQWGATEFLLKNKKNNKYIGLEGFDVVVHKNKGEAPPFWFYSKELSKGEKEIAAAKKEGDSSTETVCKQTIEKIDKEFVYYGKIIYSHKYWKKEYLGYLKRIVNEIYDLDDRFTETKKACYSISHKTVQQRLERSERDLNNLTKAALFQIADIEKKQIDELNKQAEEELAEEKRKKEIAAAKKREEERKKAEAEKKRQEEIAKLEAQKELEEKNKPKPAGSGTGFFISSTGHVITNSHVVNQCDEMKVFFKDELHIAKVISENTIYDLALLKIDQTTPQYASFSAKDGQLGEAILVFGYPFGKNLSSYIKVTGGIVSSLTGMNNDLSLLQIDAPIQPGNSGGPIYNFKGEVIGITVASIDKAVFFKEFELIPENINFGIKNSIAKIFLTTNDLDFRSSNNTTKLESEQVAQLGKETTVYVECWMPVAKMRKLRGSNNLVDFNLN